MVQRPPTVRIGTLELQSHGTKDSRSAIRLVLKIMQLVPFAILCIRQSRNLITGQATETRDDVKSKQPIFKE